MTTRATASFMEYGTEDQPATPWLRPAVRQHGEAAINTITQDLTKRIDKVVADMGAKNRNK